MEKVKISLKELLSDPSTHPKLYKLTFEDGMKLLEELVASVEAGSLALDKTIQSYEIASIVVTHLRNLLSGAEEKLKVLQKNSAGEIVTK